MHPAKLTLILGYVADAAVNGAIIVILSHLLLPIQIPWSPLLPRASLSPPTQTASPSLLNMLLAQEKLTVVIQESGTYGASADYWGCI